MSPARRATLVAVLAASIVLLGCGAARAQSGQPQASASVPGPTQARAELGELLFYQGSLGGGRAGPELPGNLILSSGGPLQLQALARNAGDGRLGVQAAVTLSDPLGNQLARLTIPAVQLVPGQTQSLEAYWGNPPALGLYSARLELQAGADTLVAQRWLLILPWQQIAAALLFALVAWGLLVRRSQGRRAEIAAELREARGPAPESVAVASAGPSVAPPPAVGGPDVPELMRWGQQAARGGDRLVGHRLFVRALESEPDYVEAWLWRAATTDQPDETIRCLERALELDPGNSRARRGLEECRRRLALGVAGRS